MKVVSDEQEAIELLSSEGEEEELQVGVFVLARAHTHTHTHNYRVGRLGLATQHMRQQQQQQQLVRQSKRGGRPAWPQKGRHPIAGQTSAAPRLMHMV